MSQRTSKAFLLIVTFGLMLAASIAPAVAVEDVYSERTVEIGRKLACPVCEGQTIADSNSGVARDMMQTIESQVQAGRSDQEIFDYFEARYGEEVLVDPPREGINLALWWLPVAALLIGLAVVALYLRDSAAQGRAIQQRQNDDVVGPDPEQIAHPVLRDPDTETT